MRNSLLIVICNMRLFSKKQKRLQIKKTEAPLYNLNLIRVTEILFAAIFLF